MKIRNWLILATVAFFFNSCAMSATQKNGAHSENSKVIATASATPTKQSVLPVAKNSPAVAEKPTGESQKSGCAAEIRGAGSRHFEIPGELCFDETKPSDKSEIVPDPPRGEKLGNTLSNDTIPLREVPREVLQVIELIIGKKTTAKEFRLLTSPNGDRSVTPNRAIIMYLYEPITDDDKGSGTFYFQKQKGKLKLVLADI